MCHKSKTKGDQYSKWSSTRHANAYYTLGTPEAKVIAEKRGVSGDPQKAPECLKCHVTAYGVDESLVAASFKMPDGIQCETCHGPGSDYKKGAIMKDLTKAMEAGLIMPTEALCVKCHNEDSPNFKGFNFEESFKKISHPRPKK